jgi:hypothetical protein
MAPNTPYDTSTSRVVDLAPTPSWVNMVYDPADPKPLATYTPGPVTVDPLGNLVPPASVSQDEPEGDRPVVIQS